MQRYVQFIFICLFLLVSLGGFVVTADLPVSAVFFQKSNEILIGNNTGTSPNSAAFYQKSNEILTKTEDDTATSPGPAPIQDQAGPVADIAGDRDETVTSPGYAVYVQGGENSITEETDGMMVLTVRDLLPYVYVSDNEKSVLSPVEDLSGYACPLNAVLVFSGSDGDSVSFVEVSNLSLSEGGRSLTLEVTPLQLYKGDILKSFGSENNEVLTGTAGATRTGIFLEIIE